MYQYEGALYWIADQDYAFEEDGSTYNLEYAKPVTIEKNCWIASDVVICGGVTVGEGSVIAAGSVVTRDLPDNVIAVGNPCRIVREIKDLRYTVLVIEPVAGCAKPLRVNISGGLWDRLRHEKQLYASVASSDIMLLNN